MVEINAAFVENLKQMIREDKIIQAIKEYRDNYNTSLKDAKDFIDELKAKIHNEEIPDEERKFVNYNEMMEFVKNKLNEMAAAPMDKITEIIDIVWDSAFYIGEDEGYDEGWQECMNENRFSDRDIARQIEMAEQRGYKRGILERS